MEGNFFILQLCVLAVLRFVVTDTANLTSAPMAEVTVDMVRTTERPIIQNNSSHVTFFKDIKSTPPPQPNLHTPGPPSDPQLPPGDFTPGPPSDPQLPPGDFTPGPPSDPQLPPGDFTPGPPSDPQLPPDDFTPRPPATPHTRPGELTPSSTVSTTPWASYPTFPMEFPFDFYDYYYGFNTRNVYIWDKKKMSAKDFQLSYCPWRCKNGESDYINEIFMDCPTIDCFDCSCERPACEIYSNCCPDISEPVFTLEPSREGTGTMVTSTQGKVVESSVEADNITRENSRSTESDFLSPPGDADMQNEVSSTEASYTYVPKSFCNTNSYIEFLYIRSCPRNFANQTVVELCEGEVAEEELTIDYMVRVYDEKTSVTYYNQYCAICNGVTQFLPWKTRIDCRHYMFVYQATSMKEFLRLATKPGSSCFVEHDLPNQDAEYHYCPGYFNRSTLSLPNSKLDVPECLTLPEMS